MTMLEFYILLLFFVLLSVSLACCVFLYVELQQVKERLDCFENEMEKHGQSLTITETSKKSVSGIKADDLLPKTRRKYYLHQYDQEMRKINKTIN